jgi:hypothetical protein
MVRYALLNAAVATSSASTLIADAYDLSRLLICHSQQYCNQVAASTSAGKEQRYDGLMAMGVQTAPST